MLFCFVFLITISLKLTRPLSVPSPLFTSYHFGIGAGEASHGYSIHIANFLAELKVIQISSLSLSLSSLAHALTRS